ncbi:uncharacterized protein BJ212DRAFT_1478033 [Suillus subaureus]|uniref:DUF6818 domain-containing protein n=1 Tax=Suillus subaureus TaxID=48587 RepID=A0A9P7EHL1_9AGAM|nr:uncharacterized protein BJ212DRAFT_1478033 [Suillus subaureus]KAG1820943.1 hypothetical protein BJ212DRAFT_1478033 [Suillus subaureus]
MQQLHTLGNNGAFPYDVPSPIVLAYKIAGSHHPNVVPSQFKGKAAAHKRKAPSVPSVTTTEPPAKQKSGHGGHASGTLNYSDDDVAALIDVCANCLPLGAKGWLTIKQEFAVWADSHDHPTHSAKSLELKFNQLVHTMKPTSDAECPSHIEHAHKIDFLMNKRASTQDLDDDKFADDVIIVGSDEDEPQHVSMPKVSVKREIQEPALLSHHSVATPTPQPSCTTYAPGLDLLTLIMASLGP